MTLRKQHGDTSLTDAGSTSSRYLMTLRKQHGDENFIHNLASGILPGYLMTLRKQHGDFYPQFLLLGDMVDTLGRCGSSIETITPYFLTFLFIIWDTLGRCGSSIETDIGIGGALCRVRYLMTLRKQHGDKLY